MSLRLRLFLVVVGLGAVALLGLSLPPSLPSLWIHYALWTLRGGKVVSLRTYYDHAQALKAMGLDE